MLPASDAQFLPTTPPPPSVSGSGRPAEPIASTLGVGTLLDDRYEILDLLGEGGMGMVYRARDVELDEEIAIKLLQRQYTQSHEDIERFKREIKTARRIAHPNIIRIFHFGVAGRDAFICMELLGGGTLAERIAAGQIPIDDAARIAVQIGDGLGAAHRLGVVHRDIKPHNVMFDSQGTVKLLDFGIARFTAHTSATKGFVGTPHYISPEQADGKPATPRSDVYSFGVLLYETFTGRVPFHSDSLARLILMHVGETVAPPRSLRDDIPEALEQIILRCLSKRPAERYEHGGRVADAFREYLGESAIWELVTHPVTESPLLDADTVIGGRYRVIEPVSPTLFRAHDEAENIDVTLRVLEHEAIAASEVASVEHALQLTRGISHPNLWKTRELIRTEQLNVLVSEFAEVESLSERLARVKSLPVGWALRILKGITAGMAAAHDEGLVHGALTAEHIFLMKGSDQAVVADLAVAQDVGGRDADVRALGRIAYQLVNGQEPHPGTDLSAIRADLPAELEEFVIRCVNPDATLRPKTAGEAMELLTETVAEPTPVHTLKPVTRGDSLRPDSANSPRFRIPLPSPRLAGIAMAIAAIVIAAFFGVRALRKAPEPGLERPIARIGAFRLAQADQRPNSVWLSEAVRMRIVHELEDAWELTAIPADTRADDLPWLEGRVYVQQDRQILLTLTAVKPDGRSQSLQAQGDTTREVSEKIARRIVEYLIDDPSQIPSEERLRADGAHDREAWRLWRRTQRLHRGQYWQLGIDIARQAVELDPTFPLPYLEMAVSYDRTEAGSEQALDKAIELGHQAEHLDPFWIAVLETVDAARKNGDVEAAYRRAQRTHQTPRQRRWALTHYAFEAYYWRDRDVADDRIQALIDTFPGDAAGHKLRAVGILRTGDARQASEAVTAAREALRLAPYDVQTRALLARALVLAGNESEASIHTNFLLAADPEERLHATDDEFRLHMLRGDLYAAEGAADRGRKAGGPYAAAGLEGDAYINLARGQWRNGIENLVLAATQYDQLGEGEDALSVRIDAALFQIELALCCSDDDGTRTKYLENASALLEPADVPVFEPHRAALQAIIADVAAGDESRARTREALTQWKETNASPLWLRGVHTELLAHSNQPHELLEYVERALELHPSPDLEYLLARTHYDLAGDDPGALRAALTHYRTFVENPQSWAAPLRVTRAHLEMGEILEKLEECNAARDEYEVALDRVPRQTFVALKDRVRTMCE